MNPNPIATETWARLHPAACSEVNRKRGVAIIQSAIKEAEYAAHKAGYAAACKDIAESRSATAGEHGDYCWCDACAKSRPAATEPSFAKASDDKQGAERAAIARIYELIAPSAGLPATGKVAEVLHKVDEICHEFLALSQRPVSAAQGKPWIYVEDNGYWEIFEGKTSLGLAISEGSANSIVPAHNATLHRPVAEISAGNQEWTVHILTNEDFAFIRFGEAGTSGAMPKAAAYATADAHNATLQNDTLAALIVAKDHFDKVWPYPNEPEIKQINEAIAKAREGKDG